MLLVIFGAGASFDSDSRRVPRSGVHAWRPPLANQLFEDRQYFRSLFDRFPRMLPLVPRLVRASAKKPLEAMLKEIQDEVARYPARHSELASIRYYLQLVIAQTVNQWQQEAQGVTNYLHLLDRIQLRGGHMGNTIFATFNYDCMFECASSFYATKGRQRNVHKYTNMASYIDGKMFRLVKLHGSIDWGYQVVTSMPVFGSGSQYDVALEVIDHIDTLHISTDITPGMQQPPDRNGAGQPYAPAIAIPVDQKNTFVCPQKHLGFLETMLPQVSAVLIIGWRGMEDHFLQMLRQMLQATAPICVVSGEVRDGQETVSHLNLPNLGVTEVLPGGFSEFVTGSGVDTFLQKVWP